MSAAPAEVSPAPAARVRPPATLWMRGAVALAAGIAVTFMGDHAAGRGLVVFAAFALLTVVALTVGSVAAERRQGGRTRIIAAAPDGVLQVLALLAAIVAIVLVVAVSDPSSAVFTAVVGGWALLSGAVEVVAGFRPTVEDRVRRGDRRFAGFASVLLAIALFAVPPGYALPYSIETDAGEQTFVLTASIIAVGLFGFYAAIVGVRLVIAGLPVPDARR